MFERIDSLLKKIEEAQAEIEFLLRLAKISFVDYVMIKRGSQDMPPSLDMWNLQQIDEEVSKLKEAIDSLNKIKKEVLTW
ncbi:MULTISPECIES: DUF2443 domain-containing protein [Helicobacter]|uniref:DUF2443 domain-containing protein n=2 Tax=Helicobacter TaxID=209 RepID=C5ZYK6_9HELI|nr:MULTISPECIES: DUF2443 domain-containing protein [Helicobacter]EES90224.1 conserved hypothetical protein [Helicobacter canadensis MIT 98-5491]EFR49018.1 hypothetical protein HCMG_01191 [Helicobacter canadensis MIT 98-5491]MCI2236724.1 DUF2443 domain-containing protein [Helicobacter sp. CaF467b]MCI7047433.1 DUF2443 domain-containing protein [Helicobacter sp.]MCI7766284.1 DUF2443 domain-containing protein [Helicobacter sp.]